MMRRVIISILFAVCSNVAFATVYYVGGAGASDNNPGTSAQPFATIQKAASLAVAGDVVNIRSGTYRETIVPANSGTPGNPIIFQPDGGSSVIISGLNTADGGWSVHNGSIYKKSITLPVNGYNNSTSNNTTLLANQIFKDGVMMFEARWPNLSTLDDMLDREKVRRMPSTPTSTTIVDAAAPQGMTGAKIWVNGWYVTITATVTGQSGSTITFSPSQSDAKKRKMYYLTGKLSLLDAEKEWHYESGTLYFRQPGGGTPTGIEYKARNYGFDLSSRTGINLVGLGFMGCTPAHGNTSTNNVIIDNIRAKYLNHAVLSPLQPGAIMETCYFNAHQTGIKLIGSNNIIRNSELAYGSSQAIWLGTNSIAENNLIHDFGYDGNFGSVMPWGQTTAGTGGQKFLRNTIYRMGRSCIDGGYAIHGQHLNMEIAYNDMSHYAMLNTDAGALYVGHFTNTTGLRTHHNWVHDSHAIFDDGICAGIYYDQGSGPHTTDHNVLWNNVQSDYYANPYYENRNAGNSNIYNNVFATVSSMANSHSIKVSSASNTTPVDLQKNNIYRQDVIVNWSSGLQNVANCLAQGINPLFVGSGNTGLDFRTNAGPARNTGVTIPGITDGSVGAPDIGAYEYGGTEWIPGYIPVATTPNTPPVVSITSPADNATFAQGSPITFSAAASDANGSVTRVEFFSGTTKLGEDLTNPYSFVWNNAAAGTHALTAKATDNANSVTTSAPVTITVTANTAPTVSVTGPANNAQFTAGASITITATAADAGGSVTKVEFFSGTTKLGEDLTMPYSFAWDNASVGTHILTAKATDDTNNVTTSTAVTITVNANPAPTVAITGPSNNTQFTTGASINIAATATDANGSVTKVEFFNGTTKLGEDLTTPYSFAWNNATTGTHILTAKATDNATSVATSSPVTIAVNANTAPVVSLTGPSNNAQFTAGTSITITATAADADGSVTKVEFFDGTTKLGEDLTSPYSFAWNNATAGTHVLTAKATDNASGVTTSTAVTIMVVTLNTAPTISITGPSNSAQFTTGASITISATAADANGSVAKVEFFDGTTKLGEDLTSPYSFAWNNAAAGTRALTAKATDNENSVTTSTTVTITVVSPNTAPAVSITGPSNNAQFTAGASITISATAADANGAVTKVEFFDGTTKLGEDLTSPYSFVWNNAPAGTHALTAKATDNGNGVTTSTTVTITVVTPNTAPTVSITGPSNNAQFTTGASITIAATASDANGSVTKVEFFDGTTKLGEDLTSPYSFIWNNVPAGSYSITAKATDNQNAVSTSSAVNISVNNTTTPTPPTANAGEDVFLTLPNNSITLTASGVPDVPDGPALQFNWTQLSGPSTVVIFDPSLKEIDLANLIEGTYVFELTVTDGQGLSSKDEVSITVVASSQNLQSSIPRFFSPNDDGTGDFWEWTQTELFQNSALTVFNRSGQKIFEAISYNNTWDGTMDGKPLQAGDYYYVIRLANNTDLKGALQIIR